jgi:membrane fusion protein, copper/silver efflux system
VPAVFRVLFLKERASVYKAMVLPARTFPRVAGAFLMKSTQDTSVDVQNASSAEGTPGTATNALRVSRTRWQKFRMIVKVVELRLRFIALMAITGLVFGYWDTIWNRYEKWMRPQAIRHAAHTGIEFFCPMHPSVVRDEPGGCPICGMPLSKRAKGAQADVPQGVTARVQLSPGRVAQAGIRTAEVTYAPLSETVTTVGSIVHDETRTTIIASKIKGMTRVEKLYVNYLGSPVREGEPLAEIYSSELHLATQELLMAHRSLRDAPKAKSALGRSLFGEPNEVFQSTVAKLRLWGITQNQIDQIVKQDKAEFRMPILAPMTGHVTKKNVIEGQIVPEGYELFQVANLSHLWVKAQVYENQLALVRVGQEVEATIEAYQGEVFPGRVAFIDPELDPATRTIGVRYDLENPDHRLRPGMFATVTLRTPIAETPPFSARAAAAAQTRSATRLASMTAEDQRICPVTGLKLGTMGDPVPVEAEGRKVWTCCSACPPKLKAKPAYYLSRLAPAPRGEVLTVPESAVIDTGARKVVYVETEPGVFDGREVVLGPRSGNRFPVLEGLAPGERVAAAGAFLVDAESRLNPATRPTNSGGGTTSPSDSDRGPSPPANPAARSAASSAGHLLH